MMKTALIALGANVTSPFGLPSQTMIWAISAMVGRGCALRSVSRFFTTPCFPEGAGPDYVNAACAVNWGGTATDLMAHLHAIEEIAARERTIRWGQRTLDLDLVALGSETWPDAATQGKWRALVPELQRLRAPEELVLPHPRLQDRAFVLEPLQDIAPDWVHPMLGLSVHDMLAARPETERAGIVPMGG